MSAQCIPARTDVLTGIATVIGGTVALCATAPPAAALAAVGAIAAAGLVTLKAGQQRPDPKPTPHTDWINDIRRQPAKMRGEGAARLMALPLTINVTQEITR